MGMIAAVQAKSGLPCIVYWTGKTKLISVKTRTYCGAEVDAGDGVLQLPEKAKFCESCVDALERAEAALPK